MVVKKCASCKKNITKKCPGLECSRCNKIVHASPECAKISNKQIISLRNTNALEWSCDDCLRNISKRSSFFIPGEESDSEDESVAATPRGISSASIDVKKLLEDMGREMRKIIKDELENIQISLDFTSEQVSKIEQSIKGQDSKIKVLENKNTDLLNKNKNLELRVAAMEQQIQEMNQKFLLTSIEITGIPESSTTKDIAPVIKNIAEKLEVNMDDMQKARRITGRREQPGPIVLEMKSKTACEQWIAAGKRLRLTVGDIVGDVPRASATDRIYIRESLTHQTKTLLFNTKQALRENFQFIWCKAGKVYARQSSVSKVHVIRSISDIKALEKNNSNINE